MMVIQKLQTLGSMVINNNKYSEMNYENSEYTSLKDIIYKSPAKASLLCYKDSSKIAIKNELVKRAASFYLQSAASSIMATRNQNCFVTFWERFKGKAVLCTHWILNHMGARRNVPSLCWRSFDRVTCRFSDEVQ